MSHDCACVVLPHAAVSFMLGCTMQRTLFLADGGLTIDLSSMKGILVDSDSQTATVQGFCPLPSVNKQRHLLGILSGDICMQCCSVHHG